MDCWNRTQLAEVGVEVGRMVVAAAAAAGKLVGASILPVVVVVVVVAGAPILPVAVVVVAVTAAAAAAAPTEPVAVGRVGLAGNSIRTQPAAAYTHRASAVVAFVAHMG